MDTSSKLLLWAISLSVLIAIIATAYIFLIKKEYDFVVEAPCDPAEEICFYRDCSTGECPPNELEYYRVLLVSAADFESCSDNSCLRECTTGTIRCEELFCDPQADEDCTAIEDFAPINPEPVFFIEAVEIEFNEEESGALSDETLLEIETNATATEHAVVNE